MRFELDKCKISYFGSDGDVERRKVTNNDRNAGCENGTTDQEAKYCVSLFLIMWESVVVESSFERIEVAEVASWNFRS